MQERLIAGFCLGLLGTLNLWAGPEANLQSRIQAAMNAGPGEWVATGFHPEGSKIVVRGLSGVGWGKGSAASEWGPLFAGEVSTRPRFVGVGEKSEDRRALIDRIAGFYANPFIVSGRVASSRLTQYIDPASYPDDHGVWATDSQKQILKAGFSIRDFDRLAILMPRDSIEPLLWVKGYLEAAKSFPPTPGTRGAAFQANVEKLHASLKFDPDGSIKNMYDFENAFRRLALLSSQGSMFKSPFTNLPEFRKLSAELLQLDRDSHNIEKDPEVLKAHEDYSNLNARYRRLVQEKNGSTGQSELDAMWEQVYEAEMSYEKLKETKFKALSKKSEALIKEFSKAQALNPLAVKNMAELPIHLEGWRQFTGERDPLFESDPGLKWAVAVVAQANGEKPSNCGIFDPLFSRKSP